MNPSFDAEAPADLAVSNTTRLALIDQKLDMIIKDHDKRITTLEVWRDTRGKTSAAMAGPWLAFVSLIVLIAGMLVWK